MASVGKKGKKSKEKKVLSLQEFLHQSTPSSGGTTQVIVQKVSSWAEECEDDDDRPSRPEFIELPTAPRAARILDDDTIPYTGPFSARVSNLPFDTNEQDIDEFFLERNIRIKEMRLARDDANDRLRGFGHIEFEERQDLIDAIMLPDAMIQNRRIRIELASENDQRDGRTVRKRYDNYIARDPTSNESTNWRDRKESNFETIDNRDNNRRNYQSRSNFQNRHDSNNNDNDDGGNWRMGDRPGNDSPPPDRRRGNYGNDRRGGRDRYERRDRYEPEEERPVLNLQPRTKPLPVLNFPKEEELDRPSRKQPSLNGDSEGQNDSGLVDDEDREVSAPPPPKPKPVPSVNIFGQAKPVDTAAREREIEEKLQQERLAKVQREKDEREKQRIEAEKNVEGEQIKKDVIVIKTEKARLQEEAVNWRKHEEPSNGSMENRNRDNGRRFIDGDRRKNDDRPRNFKDSRDRNYNRSDRDYRSNNMNRGGQDRRDDRRDNRPLRRDGANEIRRDDRETREPRRERPPKDLEERMPKYQAPSGPNLHVSNAFAGLDDEVDAD
ncbi:CLUMA_CG006523, isoform A [Clunio marinus]|uniref:CLUMA_CG006523, isoform A n=1 Tax=Clunio marinus TaxID=568069 RepID=A0A1J1I3Y1_9DIPT|nr:CLUMA_CG006523, isoform A [Clunio marinus]